jgi:hypothetical protein
MLDWLLRDWTFLGMTGQRWMPVIVVALVAYGAIVFAARYFSSARGDV